MIRRLVGAAVLLLGAFALVAPAAPASAGGGPSDYVDCSVQVAPPQFAAGREVTVIGRDFQPNFLTTIFLDTLAPENVLGTAMTNAQGFFQTRVLIPEGTTEGAHTIGAVCDGQGNISNTDVEVSSAGATRAPAAPLPRTGTDSTEPLVMAGGLALLAGVGFVVVARRRRRTHVGV
jgi:LPXTG-motif cell wall-anchored protein